MRMLMSMITLSSMTRRVRPRMRRWPRDLRCLRVLRKDLFMSQTITAMPALTRLAEDEVMFRDSVYEFADKEVRPLAREMDEQAKMSPALIEKLFELGVMSIEVPESYGGAGGTFFHSVLAVESLSRVDPSVGVLVDVQNTLVINAVMRWGTDEIKRKYLPKLASKTDWRLLPVGSRLRQRRLRHDDARGGTGRRLRASPAASCGSPTATKRTCSSCSPTSIPRPATAASPRSSSIAARRDSPSARKKTSSASAPAAPASCCSKTASCRSRRSSARSARATRSRSKR